MDENGKVLGRHKGIINYTMGQKKRIRHSFRKTYICYRYCS